MNRIPIGRGSYQGLGAIRVVEEAAAARTKCGGMAVFVSGVVIGGGLVFWAYHMPVTGHGIAINGDGALDEMRVYRDNRLIRTEVDRDLDGKADAVCYFDRRGLIREVGQDDNFDGVCETRFEYVDGVKNSQQSDLNQDGNTDFRASFKFGNLDEVVIIDEGRDLRKKRQQFRMGKRVSAEFDSDGGGSFDTEYDYDCFEEVK